MRNASRHSKVTELQDDNVSSEVIARLMGNTPQMIDKIYGKISARKLAEVLELKNRKKATVQPV